MSKALLMLAFAVLMVIIGPLATIWALNTLFPVLNIPVTLDTWLACVIFMGLFKTTIKKD
jgi:hypothetical protein